MCLTYWQANSLPLSHHGTPSSLFKFIFYWSIVEYQCCVHYCCKAKSVSNNIYMCIYIFHILFHCGLLQDVEYIPQAIQPYLGYCKAAIVLLRTQGCPYLFELKLCLEICPGVGLIDHMVILFLVCWGTCILFSTVVTQTYIPTNSVGGFPSLYNLSSICYL